jgi:hypothetical protein
MPGLLHSLPSGAPEAGGALPFRVAGQDGPGFFLFFAFAARAVTLPFRFKGDGGHAGTVQPPDPGHSALTWPPRVQRSIGL